MRGFAVVDNFEAQATVSKLKRWSINYYIDTAKTVERGSADLQHANGGPGEYYSEHETRTPVWLCPGDSRAAAALVGLTDVQRAGGEADAAVVARWLDDGVAPSGARGRALGARGVHGFDLTFAAPKSVSLLRALRADDVAQKAIAAAHTAALTEGMDYLAAHAGHTRVHNPVLRRSELLALRWSDFNADAGTISVCGKVVRQKANGLVRVDETKTAAGRRVIPLPAFPIAALAERRKLPFLGQQSVIFPSTSGTLRDPDNFAGQWRKTRDELGVPDISSHSFRKTVATLIDDDGLSARIGADHLGHAKVSMTQDRYMRRGRVHNQVADLLDKAVTGNSGPP